MKKKLIFLCILVLLICIPMIGFIGCNSDDSDDSDDNYNWEGAIYSTHNDYSGTVKGEIDDPIPEGNSEARIRWDAQGEYGEGTLTVTRSGNSFACTGTTSHSEYGSVTFSFVTGTISADETSVTGNWSSSQGGNSDGGTYTITKK